MTDSAHPTPLEALQRARLFASIPAASLEMLVSAMRPRTLHVGEALFEHGEQGDAMYVLVEGLLKALSVDARGMEHGLGYVWPGDVVGEMASLDPEERSARVVAVEPSTLLEMDRLMVLALKRNAPALSRDLIREIIASVGARLRETDALIQRQIQAIAEHRGHAIQAQLEASRARLARARSRGRRGGTPLKGQLEYSALPHSSGLGARLIEALQAQAPILRYAQRAVLCYEEDPAGACFVILQGEVEIIKETVAGPRRLAVLGPGMMVGQVALVDRQPRSATLRAHGETPLVVMLLDRMRFEAMLDPPSPLGLDLLEQIAVAGIRQLRLANTLLRGLIDRCPEVTVTPLPSPSRARNTGAHTTRVVKRKTRAADTDSTAPTTGGRLSYIHAAIGEWSVPLPDPTASVERPSARYDGFEQAALDDDAPSTLDEASEDDAAQTLPPSPNTRDTRD